LLLGFAGAFRRSELVSLNRGDLEFLPQGLKVHLRRSKTDQEGQGMLKSILPGKHEETCCVRAVQVWLQASQIQSGPIFRPINRHGQLRARRLTSHAVATILKDSVGDALRAQGEPEREIQARVAQFSGHSLRAGYVTSAAAEGAEEHAIMRQTGHKRIDTLRRYIREGDLFRHNPLKSMDL
jgi:integrase